MALTRTADPISVRNVWGMSAVARRDGVSSYVLNAVYPTTCVHVTRRHVFVDLYTVTTFSMIS